MRAIIDSIDTDGNGLVGFDEFVHVMTDGQLDGLLDSDETERIQVFQTINCSSSPFS